MLSDVERGSRALSSSSSRAVWTADGSIWHTPTAPVTETTSCCHPDSHQHVASMRAAGRAQTDAQRSNTGSNRSRAGSAASAGGTTPLATVMTPSPVDATGPTPPVAPVVADAARAPPQTMADADGDAERHAAVVTNAVLTTRTTVMT